MPEQHFACINCNAPFAVSEREHRHLRRMQFQYGAYTAEFPPPAVCPDCRLQIRTAHRNEQYMYHSQSSLGGKGMITLYAPKPPWGEPFKVFTQDEWHSDAWDGLAYGVDYDFERPFFEQFKELQKRVPRLGLVTLSNENSPYTTGTAYCRNCHLINSSEHCENCYYGKLLQTCRDCMDCSYAYDSELCYQCFAIHNCYQCTYLSYSQNCTDCWFSENLVGCTDCLFCTNLQRQSCCLFNRQVSRGELQQAKAALFDSHGQFEKAKETWAGLRRSRVHKFAHITRSEGCTGDFIVGSKNCEDCYDVTDSEDCSYVCVGVNVKDMVDCSNVYLRQELNYQMLGTIADYHCAFSIYTFHSSDVLYSDHVFHCRELFGCCGLSHKRHCVLNKQYGEDEYNELVPKIIEQMKMTGEWGCFFPVKWSPFAYNETLAYDYFPLSREAVIGKGWNWREDETRPQPQDVFSLPDSTERLPDDICARTLCCEVSGQAFRVIPQELQFYRRHRLPVPRRAPLQRHRDREALRNKRRAWQRACQRCGAGLMSSFEPGRPEVIYCEACYTKEVF